MARVLVVDDEPDIAQILKFRLERDGHEILVAADGQAAVDLAVTERPDLILLDIMMPGMSGFEVLEQIRTRRGIYKTPVVMITARRSGVDMDKALAYNVIQYITKPFDPEKVAETVKRVLLNSGAY